MARTGGTGNVVSTLEAELQAASDTLLTTLDRLAALEAETRTLTPDDPRLLEVADEIEGLAAEVYRVARAQGHISEVAQVMALTDAPDTPAGPIEAADRHLHQVLDDWRAAERELASAPPGSPAAADARTRARELRGEYRRAYKDARREGREK